MSVPAGHAADAGLLMLRAANPRVASVRSGMTRPVPQGLRRADGGTAVVTGCDEPLARGGGAARHTIGAVFLVHSGFAGGHFEMRGFAVGGLAGGDVVTGLSH